MKKFVKILSLFAFAASTAACSIESVVDDLEAQAKAQAEAQLKDAFSSAVTQVALKAVEQGQGGQEPAPAPGYSKANTGMTMNETFEINDTFTEDGATFTMAGKITMDMDGMNSTMTMDMKATWTNMKVKLDDGTEVLTNGEQTIKGDFVTEMSDPNDMSTMVMKMNMTTAGKISNVEGTATSSFEITMSFDSTTGVMKMTGTIDGKEYSEEFEMPLPGDLQGEPNGGGPTDPGTCASAGGDICYEYSGANYSSMDASACPVDATVFATGICDTAGKAGGCMMNQGTDDEYIKYTATDESAACDTSGGIWVPTLAFSPAN